MPSPALSVLCTLISQLDQGHTASSVVELRLKELCGDVGERNRKKHQWAALRVHPRFLHTLSRQGIDVGIDPDSKLSSSAEDQWLTWLKWLVKWPWLIEKGLKTEWRGATEGIRELWKGKRVLKIRMVLGKVDVGIWKFRGGEVPSADGVQGTRRFDDGNWKWRKMSLDGLSLKRYIYSFIFIFF